MKKVLFFGPYPPPVMGQSIAFKEVFDNYSSSKKVLCNSTRFGNLKFLNSLNCLVNIPIIFLFKKFDVVYFTCTRSKLGFLKDLQLLFFAYVFNKKVINHLHGMDFKSFYTKQTGLFKSMINWAYSKIDTSIVLLPEMKTQFSEFPNMKIETVKNSYSFENENIEVDVNSKKMQLLYLSNILESKGILIFLEAMENILSQFPSVTVKIAGIPMADEISSLKKIESKFQSKLKALKNKFSDRIVYLGNISGELKLKVLQESSIFVLPTFYKMEAFPISIIEAMRFGNAIITTRHNYLETIVNKNNGRLIEPKSNLDLEIKLKELLNDKISLRKIQSHNILEAKQKYNPILFYNRIKEIIEQ